MPSSDILIGTDIGALDTKTIACTTDGQVLADAYIDYDIVTPKPGWVEFPMATPFKAVCDTIKQVISQALIPTPDVKGLCIYSLIGGSGVLVNDEFDENRPAIPWLDTRAIAECDRALDSKIYIKNVKTQALLMNNRNRWRISSFLLGSALISTQIFPSKNCIDSPFNVLIKA
jgi:sugar (pentulose or hexulose) kinase